jgi:hypothetical protein
MEARGGGDPQNQHSRWLRRRQPRLDFFALEEEVALSGSFPWGREEAIATGSVAVKLKGTHSAAKKKQS